MRSRWSVQAVLVTATLFASASADADDGPDNGRFVSREEYEKLKAEVEGLKKQLATRPASKDEPSDLEAAVADLEKQLGDVKSIADAARPGTTKFLLTGYGSTGFIGGRGKTSSFDATFNPIFLWHVSDRLLFEGELEVESEAGETKVALEYADMSYIATDFLTLDVGKFLTPFGTFSERLHPAWINKLPDAPLGFGHDGIAPTSSVGAQVRGGVPVGSTKFGYALYVTNGPKLNLGDAEARDAGLLNFDNPTDTNHDKAVGGRLGFLPIPELEVGASYMTARVSSDGSPEDVRARLYGVDLSYIRDSQALGGTIDVRGEWVWSRVGAFTYDPTGALGFGPVRFTGNRDGGYGQVAFRPNHAESPMLRDLEFVARYDRLGAPSGAPEAADESRWTFGLDYWLTPSVVVKLGYQWGRRAGGGSGDDPRAVFVQFAVGF